MGHETVVTNLSVAREANAWGMFLVTGWINGEYVIVRFDRHPTRAKARWGLVSYYEMRQYR